MKIRIYSHDSEHTRLARELRDAGHRVISDDRRLPLQEADLVLVHWEWMRSDSRNDLAKVCRVHAESAVWVFDAPSDRDSALSLFALGAVDVVSAAFGHPVLLAKIERFGGIASPVKDVFEFGSYRFLDDRRTVICAGEEVFLTEKEYALALYLFRSGGDLVRRADLLRQIWGTGSQLHSRSVDVHLSRVRKKLTLDERSGWVLGSVYGQGYRLMPIGGDRGAIERSPLHQRFMAAQAI
ncbi:MAG: response regulator transcription factor [Chromatiales bacterium]|nr:response regulator transcription factor [Gammaproteobacteria bacterium]MCP5351663.1 response regulator transcription factor [Chromatiales bacterium]